MRFWSRVLQLNYPFCSSDDPLGEYSKPHSFPIELNLTPCIVPSIATEYSRNRKKHDQTATQWTQQYALPPKPVTSSNGVNSQAHSRNKGKAKAAVETVDLTSAGETSGRTRSRRPAQAAAVAGIVIDVDSDTEVAPATNRTRSGTKRKRNDTTEGNLVSRRRLTGDGSSLAEGRTVMQVGDVIVIDD